MIQRYDAAGLLLLLRAPTPCMANPVALCKGPSAKVKGTHTSLHKVSWHIQTPWTLKMKMSVEKMPSKSPDPWNFKVTISDHKGKMKFRNYHQCPHRCIKSHPHGKLTVNVYRLTWCEFPTFQNPGFKRHNPFSEIRNLSFRTAPHAFTIGLPSFRSQVSALLHARKNYVVPKGTFYKMLCVVQHDAHSKWPGYKYWGANSNFQHAIGNDYFFFNAGRKPHQNVERTQTGINMQHGVLFLRCKGSPAF